MSNRLIFQIVVEKSDDECIDMYFPDFPGTAILSMDIADGIRNAKEMLVDLVLEKEDQDQPLPTPIPSAPENIALLDANDRTVFVEIYMPPYRNKTSNKSVTKNCTLPKWLRDVGEEAGLIFS